MQAYAAWALFCWLISCTWPLFMLLLRVEQTHACCAVRASPEHAAGHAASVLCLHCSCLIPFVGHMLFACRSKSQPTCWLPTALTENGKHVAVLSSANVDLFRSIVSDVQHDSSLLQVDLCVQVRALYSAIWQSGTASRCRRRPSQDSDSLCSV